MCHPLAGTLLGYRLGTRVNPHTVVFSLFGRYILPRGGNVWTGTLIQALGGLGFNPGAVRVLVSRMKRKGLLGARPCGRRSYYELTDLGLREVSWGGGQAFAPAEGEWDGRWTLVIYSVPEEQRARRNTLRHLLQACGFGALAPGSWLSPHLVSPEVEQKWRELDIWHYLEVFRVEHLGPSEPTALVARAWPGLTALEERCRAYIAQYQPVLARLEAGEMDDGGCFAAQMQSLCDFVTLALDDPRLPATLLPADWPRPVAQHLFEELQRTTAGPAEQFFNSIFESMA